MRKSSNIQIIKVPLDSILDGTFDGIDAGAGEWLNFIDVPSGINLEVEFDGNATGARLPITHGTVIEGKHNKIHLWTDTALAGEFITIVQGGFDDIKIINAPSNKLDTIEKINDRFRPDGTAIQQTITAGSSYLFTKTNETMIRFHVDDEAGIELDANGIKYPMFEEEIYLNNLSTVKFYNDNASSIVLTIWSM